jgi:hypothetical protein
MVSGDGPEELGEEILEAVKDPALVVIPKAVLEYPAVEVRVVRQGL